MSELRKDCIGYWACYLGNCFYEGANNCDGCLHFKPTKQKQPKKLELKPCPFCGGEAERKEDTACMGHGDFCTYQIIQCKECGAHVTGGYYGENDDTIEKWNRRV